MSEWYETSRAEREREDHAEQVAMESAYEMQRDDEPEGDESDPGFLKPAPGCGHPMPQGADCCISTGPAYSVEHVGLPSPDAHATAALSTNVHDGADLEARIADAIAAAEGTTRRAAARHIIALVRDHDRRASHEGPTVSDLTAERFGPVGGEQR